MKKVVFILVFISTFIVKCQNIWELSYVFTDKSLFLEKLEVIDSNYLNLLFTSVSGWSSDNGHLYNSQDFGKSWKLIHLAKPNTYIWDMSCTDTNTFYFGLRKSIYKSLNNGKDVEIITIDSNVMYDVTQIEMLNKDIGVAVDLSFSVTKDGWKTYKYENYWKKNDSISYSFYHPRFKNDSIVTCIVGNSRGRKGSYFCEFNINSFEYKLNWMGTKMGNYDKFYVNDKTIFTCGESDGISGGSGNDGIAKSSDGGKTWRRVLDFRSDRSKFNKQYFPPFGLQSIAFKDSLTGIAVGQFGKIVYTYDGGESWIYENKLPDSLGQPATMKVRYTGSVPIIATYSGHIYRMIEDNLAPKPEDTLTISGRVWEGNEGQPGIPIELGFRITMTDSNGYYKFTRVVKGKHTVKAKNKYHDGDLVEYYYKPFDYTPVQYDLDLTSDTSGVDFNAIDLRTFYSVSGEIVTSGGVGLKDIPLTIGDSTTISTEDGKFLFPKIEQKRTYELIPYSKEYKFTPWAYSINIDKDLDTFRFVATPNSDVHVEETTKETLIISPMPADDYITINFGSIGACSNEINIWASPNASINIYDIMGILQYSSPINLTPALTEGEGVRIDISNLSSGIYFIRIGERIEKFVKI